MISASDDQDGHRSTLKLLAQCVVVPPFVTLRTQHREVATPLLFSLRLAVPFESRE